LFAPYLESSLVLIDVNGGKTDGIAGGVCWPVGAALGFAVLLALLQY